MNRLNLTSLVLDGVAQSADKHGLVSSDKSDALIDAVVEAVLPYFAQWQPIETAPRDGLPILIATGASWSLAYWHPTGWAQFSGRRELMEPTHWMPLPPLPEVTDG